MSRNRLFSVTLRVMGRPFSDHRNSYSLVRLVNYVIRLVYYFRCFFARAPGSAIHRAFLPSPWPSWTPEQEPFYLTTSQTADLPPRTCTSMPVQQDSPSKNAAGRCLDRRKDPRCRGVRGVRKTPSDTVFSRRRTSWSFGDMQMPLRENMNRIEW